MSTANDDFDGLNPTNVRDIPGGRVGELDGGKKVNVRDHSSEGSPTLENSVSKRGEGENQI